MTYYADYTKDCLQMNRYLVDLVLTETAAIVEGANGLTAEDAARHQQRHPIKRDEPVLVYAWGSGGTQEVKLKTSPESNKTSNQQRSAWKVVGKKKAANQDKQQAPMDMNDSDNAGGVKLEGTSDQEDAEQARVDAIIAEKKAKKAARKARKAARKLENAKPPVGKKKEDSEDDGSDSDWTQTSWSPSWASDSERNEK